PQKSANGGVTRLESRRLPFAVLLVFVVLSASASHAGSERTGFFLSHEFYGPMAYNYPEAGWNVQNRMTNMLAFWPPVDAGMSSLIARQLTGFNFYMQGATFVKGDSASAIAGQFQSAARICAAAGKDRSLWSLMIEWDQGGGPWVPNGRPKYTGLT